MRREKPTICTVNAAASSFDYNNIEYYFDRNFWEQDNAQRANGMYEFFGNAPIRFTVTFKNEDGTTFASQTVKYGEVPTPPKDAPVKSSTAEYEYVFEGWGEIDAVTSGMSYAARFTEKAIQVDKDPTDEPADEPTEPELGVNRVVIILSTTIPVAVFVVAAIVTFIVLKLNKNKRNGD